MGAMLIAVGMVASLLSSNATVAFILGALFSAIPVFLGLIGSPAGPAAAAAVRGPVGPRAVPGLRDGCGPALRACSTSSRWRPAMLYVNMVLLGRRHWAGGERSKGLWVHSLVRVASVIVALASLNVLVGRLGMRGPTSAPSGCTRSRASRSPLITPDPQGSAGLHPGVLQPRGPPRVRRDQGRPDRPAQGIRRAGRRPGPPEPGRDRALLARGARRREAVRDRAPARPDHRRGAAVARPRSSWASPSPRVSRRSSSRSSTAACPSSTS